MDVDSLGDSPYVTGCDEVEPEYSGGKIDLKSSGAGSWIVIGILIIFALYLIYSLYCKTFLEGETYQQKQLRVNFSNLNGEEYDEVAQNALRYGESIENPRAIDHYQMGAVYLLNAKEPQKAHEHFMQALDQVIKGKVNTRDTPFIIERIDDFNNNFMEFPNLEELPIQEAMLAHYEAVRKHADVTYKRKSELRAGDPDFASKLLLSRQTWKTDSQNVHDSAAYTEIEEQFLQVREENRNLPKKDLRNYDELTNWLRVKAAEKADDSSYKVDKVLSFLNNNYPLKSIRGDVNEQDVIVNVWRRAHDPDNIGAKEQIKEAMLDSVVDCVEGDTVVCITGRTAKIWKSLATLDKNPKIGIIKTKQALRNEIFEKAAAIVAEHVGTDGLASEQLKNDYNNSENTAQVQDIIEVMRGKIDDLRPVYQGLLDKNQLDLVLAECKSAV